MNSPHQHPTPVEHHLLVGLKPPDQRLFGLDWRPSLVDDAKVAVSAVIEFLASRLRAIELIKRNRKCAPG